MERSRQLAIRATYGHKTTTTTSTGLDERLSLEALAEATPPTQRVEDVVLLFIWLLEICLIGFWLWRQADICNLDMGLWGPKPVLMTAQLTTLVISTPGLSRLGDWQETQLYRWLG